MSKLGDKEKDRTNELVALLQQNPGARNESAFTELYNLHAKPLKRFIENKFYRQGSENWADDCVQESFLSVARNIDRFNGESKFSTWLTTIAIRQAYLILLRGNRELTHGASEITEVTDHHIDDNFINFFASPPVDPVKIAQIHEACRALDAYIDREMEKGGVAAGRLGLLEKSLDGMEYREIGAEAGIPTGTVRSGLNRVRESLKKEIAEPYLP